MCCVVLILTAFDCGWYHHIRRKATEGQGGSCLLYLDQKDGKGGVINFANFAFCRKYENP